MNDIFYFLKEKFLTDDKETIVRKMTDTTIKINKVLRDIKIENGLSIKDIDRYGNILI